MNLNTHLELAGRLASDDVGAAYESGTHHLITTWAQAYLENKFARMTPDELLTEVKERAPYLLED